MSKKTAYSNEMAADFWEFVDSYDELLDEIYPAYKLDWKILKEIKISKALKTLHPKEYRIGLQEELKRQLEDAEDDRDSAEAEKFETLKKLDKRWSDLSGLLD